MGFQSGTIQTTRTSIEVSLPSAVFNYAGTRPPFMFMMCRELSYASRRPKLWPHRRNRSMVNRTG